MKNLCLIILSLFLVNTSFAQTKKTKSSISITHEERWFSLDASFSVAIDSETKEAIIEEISRVLELEPKVNSKNAYVWEDASMDDPIYIFRLNEKRCKIKIKKKGIDRNQFDRLCELGEEVGALLGKRSKEACEKEKKSKCTSSRTETSTSSSTKKSTNRFLNLSIANTVRGEATSVSINENASSFHLSAAFSDAMLETIVEKIKAALNDTSTGNYERLVWKDNKKDGGYHIGVENKFCKIDLNKKTLSVSAFEEMKDLCIDIANLVSNGDF